MDGSVVKEHFKLALERWFRLDFPNKKHLAMLIIDFVNDTCPSYRKKEDFTKKKLLSWYNELLNEDLVSLGETYNPVIKMPSAKEALLSMLRDSANMNYSSVNSVIPPLVKYEQELEEMKRCLRI